MSLEAHKTNIRRVFEDGLSRGEQSVVHQVFAPDLVDHASGPDDLPGVAGIEAFVRDLRRDLQATIDALFGEGNFVASVEIWRGTHATSGQRVEGTVLHVFRFSDGQVVEEWSAGWEWLASVPFLPAP